MPGYWDGSNRRDTLPENWSQIRRTVIARDGGRCQAILESTGMKCLEPATDVDHINRFGSQTDLSNLQMLCSWHHARKSSVEGNQVKRAYVSNKRPPKRHPGLIQDKPPVETDTPPF